MIGDFKIMGNDCYLHTNNSGTLARLPRLKWYFVLYFYFKSKFGYRIHLEEVRELANKSF